MEPTREQRTKERAYQLSLEHPHVTPEAHWFAASLQVQEEIDAEFAELIKAYVETLLGAREDQSTLPFPVDLSVVRQTVERVLQERGWTEAASLALGKPKRIRVRTPEQKALKNQRAREARAKARKQKPRLRVA